MGNQYWGLGIHMIFISIYLLANIYTCLSAGNITTMACSWQDKQALLKFKHSVKDDAHMLSSWVGNDCCRWARVHCDHVTGYIQRLYLRGVQLVGYEVSASLGELTHLKYLDLSGNDFKGSRIPKFIGSFEKLRYLNLSHSWFSGIVPHHIGNLSNLKVLDLNFWSQLVVDDVAWISGLSSLEHLDLSSVDLSGAKNGDMVLQMIPKLVKVSLSGCKLSNADLVSSLNSSTTFTNIKYLDLSHNLFYGQVPHILQNLTSLEFLDLSYFNFSHAWKSSNLLSMIPFLLELHLSGCSLQEIHLSPTHLNYSLLSNIQHLDLSNNLFQGIFPSVLTNMTSLQVLDLSSNGLNSSVPVMPNLLELDLSYNEFRQIEDVGIWRRCHLKEFQMSGNEFEMEMTDSSINTSECSQYALERLYLEGSVIGKIPESLGRMANLRSLSIYNLPIRRAKLYDYALKLTTYGLTGPIPASLGGLRLLEELNLSYNELTGPIPIFLGKLVILYLSHNYLNGSIPESIGRLVSLQAFIVSSNSLNGTLPVSIGQLTELQFLDVSDNCLEGVVSEIHFANLSMLKYLYTYSNSKLTFNVSRKWMPPFQLINVDLSSCKIEDGFPQWLRSQRKLESLSLSNATISGPLPAWFSKKPNIVSLDLSHNNLSGPLTNLPKTIITLLLQNNRFSESIPLSLCKGTTLGILNLSRNRLTGKIPKCLGDLHHLEAMLFSSNKLSGVIPSSLGHHSQLGWLNLNNNSFTGKLPQQLVVNLKNLQVLDLGDNEISGSIPESIGEKLASLVVFRLHRNKFSGQIPPSLCQMSNLQILDLAHNSLSGPIPHCLRELDGMLSSTVIPYIPDDYGDILIQIFMKGVALEYSETLRFVINMDLSSNKLVGEIPVEITALNGLVGLNLSNNNLIGGIPDNIGSMKQLTSLDFSANKLTGTIPPSIAALNFLSSLNLSHNNLSGQIPSGNQLRTLIDPSIYAGNEDLCGAPLPKNCSDPVNPKTPFRNSHDTANGSKKAWLFGLDIMGGFATGFWGVVGVLVFKKQWRHKFFMYAETTAEKIYVTVMVRVDKMKRGTQTA